MPSPSSSSSLSSNTENHLSSSNKTIDYNYWSDASTAENVTTISINNTLSDCSNESVSKYPCSTKYDSGVVILKLNFQPLFYLICGTAIMAVLSAFVLGFTVDLKKNIGYKWTCGKLYLPSFSRIINHPLERLPFNFLMLIHTGLRPIVVLVNCRRSYIRANIPYKARLNSLIKLTIMISGFVELVFLAALTIVGDREEPCTSF
uniref:G_PROTEIN_RECEP_F1_2 domain-containing protein n=1 Tax=Syphacia muris TaxID=451379 RepID=A0A0N5AZ26_9BILA